MKYEKLRKLIKKKFGTQAAFAKAMELNRSTINERLCGLSDWKRSEIEKACILLDITPTDIHDYFFEQKVAI